MRELQLFPPHARAMTVLVGAGWQLVPLILLQLGRHGTSPPDRYVKWELTEGGTLKLDNMPLFEATAGHVMCSG